MAENSIPGLPLYFELKYRDCPHIAQIPYGHGANCKEHCFICQPEKREQPLPGKCSDCEERDRLARLGG
jgi:hypothetical protein